MLELTLNVRDQRLLLGPGFCFRQIHDSILLSAEFRGKSKGRKRNFRCLQINTHQCLNLHKEALLSRGMLHVLNYSVCDVRNEKSAKLW